MHRGTLHTGPGAGGPSRLLVLTLLALLTEGGLGMADAAAAPPPPPASGDAMTAPAVTDGAARAPESVTLAPAPEAPPAPTELAARTTTRLGTTDGTGGPPDGDDGKTDGRDEGGDEHPDEGQDDGASDAPAREAAPETPVQEPSDNGRHPGRGAPAGAVPGPGGRAGTVPGTDGPDSPVSDPRSKPSPDAPPADAAPQATAPPGNTVPATADGTPVFVDRAAATGLDFVHFNGMSGQLHFGEVMGSGAALLDYDGDGDLDVYLVQGDRLAPDEDYAAATPPPGDGDRPPRDRLYRNLLVESGELRFRDVTAESGIDGTGYGMGAAVGDVDGDGDPDLYVTNLGGNRLWLNRGDGTFADVTAASRSDDPRWSTAATFLDFDLDGDLDLFVGNYVAWTAAHPERCTSPAGHRDYCGPLNYDPVADRLLENRGPGEDGVPRFVNVSAPTGIRFSFGAALGALAHDLVGDPRPEIYVANDASGNQLWTAGEGAWRDVALETGSALNGQGRPEGSMGIDAGDYDGDGDLDLFLTHVHRETNTLYRNDGDGHFADATAAAGLAGPSLGLTGFGAGFLDYDNDGWLDLLAVNGAVTRLPGLLEAGDPYPLHQPDQLFRNLGTAGDGDGTVRFADVSATAGADLALPRVSRGAAFGDVDNDGDLDVLVSDSSAPVRLLINQVGSRHHWLGLTLLDAAGRLDPAARVTLELPSGRRLLRRVRIDGSYLSAHDPRVLVGLGEETEVTAAVVRWADGEEERFPLAGEPVDRYLVLRRGTAPTADSDPR